MNTELLPGPFCGGQAICDPVPAGTKTYHQVFCRSVITCGAAGSPRPVRAEAIASWNRRANMPAGLRAEPPITWRCFHCDYIATSKAEGRAHFGAHWNAKPACDAA
jgi:hypothetical protein